MIQGGLDAKNFLNDILEILYLFSRRINLGPIEKDIIISESETKLIDENAKNLDTQDIGLFWQLTIKTIEDLKIVSNENLALEMYIMQLIHLKDISQTENFEKETILENNLGVQNIQNEKNKEEIDTDKEKSANPITNQLKNTDQIKESLIKNPDLKNDNNKYLKINNFKDLINIAKKEKELELKYDLERNIKLVSFDNGKIEISFDNKISKDFIKRLTEKLLLWTGKRWIISLSKKNGTKTFYEQELQKKSKDMSEAEKDEITQKFFTAFDDAKLIDVEEGKDD